MLTWTFNIQEEAGKGANIRSEAMVGVSVLQLRLRPQVGPFTCRGPGKSDNACWGSLAQSSQGMHGSPVPPQHLLSDLRFQKSQVERSHVEQMSPIYRSLEHPISVSVATSLERSVQFAQCREDLGLLKGTSTVYLCSTLSRGFSAIGFLPGPSATLCTWVKAHEQCSGASW